jgi:hypothetical protein
LTQAGPLQKAHVAGDLEQHAADVAPVIFGDDLREANASKSDVPSGRSTTTSPSITKCISGNFGAPDTISEKRSAQS